MIDQGFPRAQEEDIAFPFGFSQGHDYSVSLEVCLGSPFMASAPSHPQSLTLLHLPSKDHHFLCFQRPFLTAPSTAVLVEKAPPPPQGGMGEEPCLTQFSCWLCSPWARKFPFCGPHFLHLYYGCTMVCSRGNSV